MSRHVMIRCDGPECEQMVEDQSTAHTSEWLALYGPLGKPTAQSEGKPTYAGRHFCCVTCLANFGVATETELFLAAGGSASDADADDDPDYIGGDEYEDDDLPPAFDELIEALAPVNVRKPEPKTNCSCGSACSLSVRPYYLKSTSARNDESSATIPGISGVHRVGHGLEGNTDEHPEPQLKPETDGDATR